MKRVLILGLGLLTISHYGWASGPGTTAGSVLGMGVGARAIGMGEAFTAMADDVSSIYWNPAGIALLNQSQTSFMYNQSYREMNYNNAGLGLSLENGGVGGSVSYLGFGKIEGFDELGNPSGNVNAYSGVATVGGGLLLDPLALGFNVKAVQGVLADVKATGVAFDVGTTWVYPEPILGDSTLRLGATLRNMGTGMKYIEQKDPFPTEYRVGASLLELFNKKLNLGLDYGKARGDNSAVYVGSEYWLHRILALRLGYAGNDVEGNGIRVGMGLRIRDISFDYAFASYGDLGLTHRYELLYRFGEIRPRLTPEERKLLRQAKQAIRDQRFGQAVLLLDSLIRMEPKYKQFRRLYKVALHGDEQQDRLAQGQKTFSVIVPHNASASGTLSDLDDIESLLNTSDAAMAQTNPSVKSLKEKN